MEWQETVEEVQREEADVRKLFEGDGVRVRTGRRRTPKYMKQLKEAANFVADVVDGGRPLHHLKEAMSTSDFPLLFADILDRQLLGSYQELQPVWRSYIKTATVPDFRLVERMAIDGAEGRLPEVDELEEYPEAELQEARDRYKVRKYGRRIDLSWEALVNDDLDAFRRSPDRLARGARRTEQHFATTMYVDEDGPRADLYTVDNNNIIPGNPELSVDGITTGLEHLATFTDVDGEPILLDQVHLVVPPALEVRAESILQATLFRMQTSAGGNASEMETRNWLQNRLQLHVDPYIPYVAQGAVRNSAWFLFADPNSGRSFAEIGFLRGYETPALYERIPNARRVGGGGEAMESFEDDSVAWRIRHVLGGGLLLSTGGAKATAASDGSGS